MKGAKSSIDCYTCQFALLDCLIYTAFKRLEHDRKRRMIIDTKGQTLTPVRKRKSLSDCVMKARL